jgi:hypothetical protein
MDPDAAQQQPTGSAGGHPGVPGRTGRGCVLFGCLEGAAWIVSDP